MSIARQFTIFSLVGVIAAVAHYGTLIGLVEFAGATPVPASLAGFGAGALVSYGLNYRYTFQSQKQHREALLKFLVVAGIGFFINGALMGLFTGTLAMHYLPAQVLTTGAILIWTFSCNRFWTFREGPRVKRS